VGDCEFLRRRLAAVCGRYCGECNSFQSGSCCGCGYQLGRTHQGECAIFECCVADRGLEHCGLCVDFACQVFLSHATPQEVAVRYQALCRRTRNGTDHWLEAQEG
jgi:hypothetical protein